MLYFTVFQWTVIFCVINKLSHTLPDRFWHVLLDTTSLSLQIDHINFLFSSFEPYDHSKSFRITVINHYLLWIEYSYLSWLYYAVYVWSWIVYEVLWVQQTYTNEEYHVCHWLKRSTNSNIYNFTIAKDGAM